MSKPFRSRLFGSVVVAALSVFCGARGVASAWGAPGGPSVSLTSFHEGDRVVEVERVAAASPGFEGAPAGLTPVRLRFAPRAGALAREVRAFVDRTAIVRVDPGSEGELAARGVKIVRPLMPAIGLYLVEDTTGGDGIDAARRLQPEGPREQGIRHAAPKLYLFHKARGEYTPNDPKLGGQWYFKNLKMTEAWDLEKGDPSVNITVVDTGCDLTHPDLVDKMDPGRDVADQDDDPSPVASEDGAAHGTACAGLCAASTNNSEGIAGGCPECRLRCVRLLAATPVPESADVDAFQFAFDKGAAVVSNSWGFVDPMPVPKALEAAINNVYDSGRGGKGAIVVFAMGNDDREIADDEMEAVRGVLAIGAINNLDQKTPFTNRGNCTDLVAPTGTLSTDIVGPDGFDPGDYTTLFGGTSSACPVAAGIAGLMVSAAPDKTSAELVDILIKTARVAPYAVPDANGHDPVFGYGIIDPVKALQTALGVSTGGTGGAGGATSTGGTTGGGGAGGGGGSTEKDTGCSCNMPGTEGETGGALFALGAAALVWGRRRRRS
ncbi:MAG: S8 family serine peptidase [Polyangiaceae bacterium]